MKLWKSTYYSLISIMVIHLVKPLKGDYVLRVRVHSYSNPDNYCAQCNGGMGCCDDARRTTCSESLRCDNKFFFCVRPLSAAFPQTTILSSISEPTVSGRAGLLGCLQPATALRSGINRNGGTIDFSGTSFLGLSNPLEFEITATMWEGIQFYMDVFDDDPGGSGGSPSDLVDAYRVPINLPALPAGLPFTPPISYDGRFSLSSTVLSFQLECQPGFVGGNCKLCDQIITTTMNELTTITTDASASTGDAITSNNNETNTSSNINITSIRSSNAGTVAGAVIGSLIFVILIIIIVVITSLLLVKHRANTTSKPYTGANNHENTMDNPVYDITLLPGSGNSTSENIEGERDLDNPIYGLPDDSSGFTYEVPTSGNDHFDVMYSNML